MTNGRHEEFETELILGNNSYLLFGQHRWIKGGSFNGEFRYRTHIANGNHRLVLCIRGPKANGFPIDEFVNEYLIELPLEQLPTVLDYARNFRRRCANRAPSVKVLSESTSRTAIFSSNKWQDQFEIYFLGYGTDTIEPGVERLILAPQGGDFNNIEVNDLRACGAMRVLRSMCWTTTMTPRL